MYSMSQHCFDFGLVKSLDTKKEIIIFMDPHA